jgi:hypothetical protein
MLDMPTDIAERLRSARLGHTLLRAAPGCALEVGRVGGPAVVVGPVGYPSAEVLPCQHRGALVQALATGSMAAYARGLGLQGPGGSLYLRLLVPPGADLGTGVVAYERPPDRALVVATTLCAHRAARAARGSQTLPASGSAPIGRPVQEVLVDLQVEVDHDADLGTTALTWSHRPHPAVTLQVDEAVRAAAAACLVEELLIDVGAA